MKVKELKEYLLLLDEDSDIFIVDTDKNQSDNFFGDASSEGVYEIETAGNFLTISK